MALPHVVVLAAALLALLCLPCAVAVVLRADQVALRRSWVRRDAGDLRALRRLDHSLSGPVGATAEAADGGADNLLRPGETLPCIEQIVAELRRLDRQRRCGPSTESTVWLATVLRAYDEWLRLACQALGVPEHLQPLEGLDRDVERIRVEVELQANGVALR
jgi:hypothetical protein